MYIHPTPHFPSTNSHPSNMKWIEVLVKVAMAAGIAMCLFFMSLNFIALHNYTSRTSETGSKIESLNSFIQLYNEMRKQEDEMKHICLLEVSRLTSECSCTLKRMSRDPISAGAYDELESYIDADDDLREEARRFSEARQEYEMPISGPIDSYGDTLDQLEAAAAASQDRGEELVKKIEEDLTHVV